MSEIPPDPDFRLADSGAAVALRNTAETLSASAASLRTEVREFLAANSGHGADVIAEGIRDSADTLSRAADEAAAAAQLQDACVAARDRFRSVTADATVADVQGAFTEWQTLRTQLMAADDRHAALYRRAMADARDRYEDLLDRRRAAIRGYESAEDAATASYQETVGRLRGVDWSDRSTTPDAPETSAPPTTPVPAPALATPVPTPAPPDTPTPGARAGGLLAGPGIAPIAPGDPDARLAPVADTAAPTAPSAGAGLSPAQAAALGAALAQPQQQPVAQPQPQPQPAMPVMPQVPAAQQQRQPENPFANANADQGLNDLLGPALLSAGLPGSAAAAVSPPSPPLFTPAAAPTPAQTFAPLGPGLSGVMPANPVVVNPVVTGSSISGLTTDNNVTGRPDGTPARTATSPTHLAGAAAANAVAAGDAAQQRTAGHGPGMMPMMPMVPGAAGAAGGGKDRDPVTAKLSPDQAELMGLETVAEAVPGGTIARKGDAA